MKALLKGLLRTLKVLVFLLVLLYILLWVPWVQTQIGHFFAKTMSKLWDTTVRIERVEITPLSNFKFHNFFIQDHAQDTLIFARYAEAENYNVFSLFKKKIDIGRVIVKDAVFKVQRQPKEKFFNIHFLIAFFEGKNDGSPRPKKFELQMGGADLVRARIHLSDAAIGTTAIITCDTAYVHPHNLRGVDMIGKKVWADKTHLIGSHIDVHMYDALPLANEHPDSLDLIPVDSTIPYWDVGSEKLLVNELSLSLRNDRNELDSSRWLDFNNLKFSKINLDVDSFRLQKEVFTGQVRQLQGIDHGGFELKSMRGDALISPQKVAVSNLRLETNSSQLGRAITLEYSRYRDFFDFSNKVKIMATFDSLSVVTFRDIAAFGPAIRQNIFIRSNLDRPIYLQGRFKGKVNNFRARDVDIRLGPDTHIAGNLSMNDISFPDAAFMDLNLKEAATNYKDLKSILPFVKFPPNISTLGQLRFKGSYTGFFQDFVAYGQLDTKLGQIRSDLQLNIRKGKAAAAYKGGLVFKNFDVGTYLNQKDVGRLTIKSNVKGLGLTIETLNAKLENAKIDSFDYKGYQYKDILIDGMFRKKQFDGDIVSRDSNMAVLLRGIVDFNESIPRVNIRGTVDNINFEQLNISKDDIALHLDTFDINAKGSNLDNFTGDLSVRGIQVRRETIASSLNSVVIKANNIYDSLAADTRVFNLRSDIMDVSIWGKYDVVNLVRSLENFFKINHPNLFKELQYNQALATLQPISIADLALNAGVVSLDTIPHQEFDIRIDLKDSKNLTQLLDKKFRSLKDIELTGHYFGMDGYLELEGKIGALEIGDIGFNNIVLNGNAEGPEFVVNTVVKALNIKGKPFIPGIEVSLDAIGDSVLFIAKADAVGEFASKLDISGKLEINENLVVLRLDTSSLNILDQSWVINDDNYVKVGDKVLDISNVLMYSGDKKIELKSINNNLGAEVKVDNMDLGWLYSLMKPIPKVAIDGRFSGLASIQNVFNQQAVAADFLIDTLLINRDFWGANSRFQVQADSIKSTFRGVFTHSSDFVDTLYVRANFTPTIATQENYLQNLLDLNITVEGAKASILEYFLKEQISSTEGFADAKARIFGKIQGKKTQLNIEGDGLVSDVRTTVNFLQTTYVLSNGNVKIDNNGFHVDPPLVLRNGKEYFGGGVPVVEASRPLDTAYIGGRLVHDHLKNFGLDITAVMKNNLAMNTTIEDNSTFFGTVYATGTASFSGPFEKLKLKVDATTEPNTTFNLPLGGPLEVAETNYISFVDKTLTIDSSTIKSVKDQVLAGLDIEIIAHIQPSAVARLIIDEQAGDIIEGSGKSDLRINYSPTGELQMFGDFEITEGNYLFTYKNLINKPFKVIPGGTITWGENDGDPYRAQLDMQAAYQKGLGVGNLISGTTAGNPELTSLANQPCNVDLLMSLRGELFEPDINFDIKISDVPARLQNMVNVALRAIKADKNELNRQVFGVIALQQFLPLENNVDLGNSVLNTGISTVSELVSQQLTLYINDLIEGVIKDVGFISSLEFDFNFNVRDSDNQTINSRTSNVRLGSDVKFLNDKLTVYAGANMDIASENQTLQTDEQGNNYIGGDFRVEYALTNNGQLKIKAYNRTESTILGRSVRTGIGFSYKKEFNSLKDLVDESKENQLRRWERVIFKMTQKIDSVHQQLNAATTKPIQLKKLNSKIQKWSRKRMVLQEKLKLYKKREE